MNERVLYMEDDAAQARLVKKCLERSGYIVDLASDGAAGLAACAQNHYDAAIIDQTMPGLSGLDVIRLMAACKSPPIVMVTGTGNERIAVEAMKLGVSDYLVKDLEGGFVNVLPLVVGRAIEQRRLREESARMERELAQAQRMRAIGQLAAGIAHEINTPTQYIGNNARFLKDAFHDVGELLNSFGQLLDAARNNAIDDDLLAQMENKLRTADLDYLAHEIPQAIEQSLEGVQQVASIVGAMKEFSHPGDGGTQSIDLNRAICGAIALCHGEWKYVADVVTDFDSDLPAICCIPTDINSVMLNLLINAIHAIAEVNGNGAKGKGRITIRTRLDGDCVEIRIQDTGAGIPEDIRSRIFDLFFTTKEVGRGTGQGLSLAQATIVDKYGGTIDFETELGHGTTFIVRLPIAGRPQSPLVGSTAVASDTATEALAHHDDGRSEP